MNFPTLKENPVVIALITVIVCIGLIAIGFIAGYHFRAGQEAQNEVKIISDDEVVGRKNELELKEDLNEVYNNAEILNSYEEDECAKCWGSVPLPDEWGTIMQSEREQESLFSD